MTEDLERLRRAGRQLQRIRIAEQPAADGAKQVWHAAPGVEIVTRVNWMGRAYWQEITVERRLVRWTRDGGVCTGLEVSDGRGETGHHDSTLVKYDEKPAREVLQAALAVAESAPAGDRYLEHLAGRLRWALEDGGAGARDTVTDVKPVTLPAGAKPAKPPPGLLSRIGRLFGKRR